MLFAIRHTTRYSYGGRVLLGPVIVRLRPRESAEQKLHRFELRVDPEPAGFSWLTDLDGTSPASMWFEGHHDFLSIVTTSEVETLRSNPFDYILHSGSAIKLPFQYEKPLDVLLAPYTLRRSKDPRVHAYARETAESIDWSTGLFLTTLCERIAREIVQIHRAHGDPWAPEVTLEKGQGSCRDVAMLFMECCRSVGLAARFVSGYVEGFHPEHHPELHAWAAVYLPGGGWRGFDPSMGMAVAERHVAVAAAADPLAAAPVSGSFIASHSESHLWYDISIEVKSRETSIVAKEF